VELTDGMRPYFCLTRSSHSMSCDLSNRLKEFREGFLVPWAGTMYYLFTAHVGGSRGEGVVL
jgi:hypothetical protein